MHELSDEQRNVRTLFRVVGGLVAWVALSIGLTMAFIDLNGHLGHILLFLPLGTAALVVCLRAGALARRLVHDPDAVPA